MCYVYRFVPYEIHYSKNNRNRLGYPQIISHDQQKVVYDHYTLPPIRTQKITAWWRCVFAVLCCIVHLNSQPCCIVRILLYWYSNYVYLPTFLWSLAGFLLSCVLISGLTCWLEGEQTRSERCTSTSLRFRVIIESDRIDSNWNSLYISFPSEQRNRWWGGASNKKKEWMIHVCGLILSLFIKLFHEPW